MKYDFIKLFRDMFCIFHDISILIDQSWNLKSPTYNNGDPDNMLLQLVVLVCFVLLVAGRVVNLFTPIYYKMIGASYWI